MSSSRMGNNDKPDVMVTEQKRFYAHSTARSDRENWQGLREHLLAVAEGAEAGAARFGAGGWGHAAGLLHDLGKYSDRFQKRLAGDPSKVDHATAGAIEAEKRYAMWTPLQFVVAGHHAGLADGSGESDDSRRSTLEDRLGKQVDDYAAFEKEIVLPERLNLSPLRIERRLCGFQVALFTRMLLGCLVGADHGDTKAFEERVAGKVPLQPYAIDLPALAARLDRHLEKFATPVEPAAVDGLRAEVLAACRAQANLPKGTFTLTVPTGGGKTLASLAFALRHAITHGMDRIVYVVPFASIIEQNADVFRAALGDDAVLEHHSGFDECALDEDSRAKLRHVTASWEAPVVMTTAVQFFESLFSDRPGKCKKLPSIANAVIVLDEVQTLPLPFLRPCVAVLGELVRNYRFSVVLCTATQPVVGKEQGFAGGLEQVREIAPEPERLYQALRRVTVSEVVELDGEALAARLHDHTQVLCIVDTRNQAHDIARLFAPDEAHFHLSLNMCAKHRSQKLGEIRDRLARGLPCRVVSTSLIEAGVDVDFPAVYRAETGLDQLAQAAGRCNRNGRQRPENSVVQPFRFAGAVPRGEQQRRIGAARGAVRRHDDSLGLAALHEFFTEVYWSEGGWAGQGGDLATERSACRPRAGALRRNRRQVQAH